MQKQDEQLLSLRVEITVVIKVLPVIHTVSSIDHLVYLALAKILLLSSMWYILYTTMYSSLTL